MQRLLEYFLWGHFIKKCLFWDLMTLCKECFISVRFAVQTLACTRSLSIETRLSGERVPFLLSCPLLFFFYYFFLILIGATCIVLNFWSTEKAGKALKSTFLVLSPEKWVSWGNSFTSLPITSDKTEKETSCDIEALKNGVFQLLCHCCSSLMCSVLTKRKLRVYNDNGMFRC